MNSTPFIDVWFFSILCSSKSITETIVGQYGDIKHMLNEEQGFFNSFNDLNYSYYIAFLFILRQSLVFVTQAAVQWRYLSSLQSSSPGFK